MAPPAGTPVKVAVTERSSPDGERPSTTMKGVGEYSTHSSDASPGSTTAAHGVEPALKSA